MMKYPAKVHVFGHEIEVEVLDAPIETRYTEKSDDGVETISIARINGMYDPNELKISVVDNPEKPSMGETNLFHEIIEAIDCHGDLQMNHTQISTLSSALYQVWKEMPAYSEAA